jgi:hypothetical protein
MRVDLNKRISFLDDKIETTTTEIRQIVCRDAVEIDSYEYSMDDELIGVRKASVGVFSINLVTGLSEANGPGTLIDWYSRQAKQRRVSFAKSVVAQSNQPLEATSSEWEYTKITFTGKAIGHIKKKETRLNDQVHVVYGPVDRLGDTIDPENLPRDAGEVFCDVFHINQRVNKDKKEIELRASGNARMSGRTHYGRFFGRADTISYDDSKSLIILRSDGDRQATFWHQKKPGAKRSVANAQRMEFTPSRNRLISSGISTVTGFIDGTSLKQRSSRD